MFSAKTIGLRRIGRWAGAATLMVASWAQAAAPDCAPAASAQLPVIDTGLPVVQIWTVDGAEIWDRENYVDACMRITDGTDQKYGTGLYYGTLKIRGRGNATWWFPKKGYRLKLTDAAAVLDMPAHKDWVLLANYADKTLMRNAVGFELSRIFGMAWTPRMRFAEFYLNNQFLGNYQIGEKIEVAPTRVAITPMKKSDVAAPAVEGGYLLEVDYTDRLEPADAYFTTQPGGYNFVLKDPAGADVQPAQMAYIAGYTQALENSIFAGDFNPQTGVPSRLDVDSMVDYYLVQEILKNKDAAMGSSVYLTKDRGGKLVMGPLWDFDIGAGNIDFYPLAHRPEGWYLRNASSWFYALMQTPEFKRRVVARWNEVYKPVKNIRKFIGEQEKLLKKSQQANFERWPILGTYVWPNQVVTGSYKGEVDWLDEWLKDRIKWMDKHIKD